MKKSVKGNRSSFSELFSKITESDKSEFQPFKRLADSDWMDDQSQEPDEDDYEDDYIKSEHELFAEYYPINPKDADW